ncbi:mitomycin radical oxidase [Dactylonectria macrodidyma]|uniref:Mitomycin radical oxidase n=1 Tax=Dactylonectria macrodidyma TaxID=307937 RepID=A0A9P9ERI8_9HYPO|nr:mitomycin radical oxidase [Dactylonectria macrodidyma]
MASTMDKLSTFLSAVGLDSTQIEDVKERAGVSKQFAEHALAALYPDAVDAPDTSAYDESVKCNWSALARRNPSAIFHPSSPEQAAKAVQILEFFDQQFAIRGGGHSPNPGWASIEGGVLISTDRLNDLHYDESSKIASIGAGNRWGLVYSYLEKFGVLVTGGHSSPVGCVGQITGCGNSPWFHKYGWSCDNVVNFEVVTAGGKIINANKGENADLWWALKGGSNNFGIVTRMDMLTFPVPNGVWGGMLELEWSIENQRKVAEAYYKFQSENIVEDPGVESIPGWGKFGSRKYLQNVLRWCTSPRIRDFADNNPRSSMLSLTVKADLDFYYEAIDIFYNAFEAFDKTTQAAACLNMSPLSARTIRLSNQRGGTAPGWAEEDQSLVFIDNAWLHEKDTEYILEAGNQCIARLRKAAKARGVLMPQIWMNNSGPDDDVIASYGKENWTRLRDISVKYDPKRTFQRLCVGGYKIERE